MKNIFVAIVSLLLYSPVFGAGKAFDLKMEIAKDGKVLSSPRVTAKTGEKTTVTQDTDGIKYFLEVVATDNPGSKDDSILMNFVTGEIEKNGKRTHVYETKMIALEGKSNTITIGPIDGKSVESLKVVATRKAL